MQNKPPYQRDSENKPKYGPGRSTPRAHRGRALFPLVIFGAVVLFIASREVPWVKDKINALIAPDKQAAIALCREAAINESPQPEFARIIKGGEATETQNGFVIDRVVLGELSTSKGEQRVRITCHVSRDGVLANLHRETLAVSPYTATEAAPRSSGPPTK